MTASVTANITVQFGSTSANLHLSAEVDSRSDGLNKGDTSFQPGDTVFFLVYKSDAVVLDVPISSAGTIATQQSFDIDKEEFITFANQKTGSVQKPIKPGTLTVKWLGRDLGAVTVDANGTNISASQAGIAVAKVNYKTTVQAYTINAPSILNGETSYQILIFVTGSD